MRIAPAQMFSGWGEVQANLASIDGACSRAVGEGAEILSYMPKRARDNRFHALFVNQSGQPHPALRIVGPSFSARPRGEVVVQTHDEAEQILQVDVL